MSSPLGLPDEGFAESYEQWLRQTRRDELTPEDIDALWCAEMQARESAGGNDPDDPEPPTPGGGAALPEVALMFDDELIAVALDPGADEALLVAVVEEILVRIRSAHSRTMRQAS